MNEPVWNSALHRRDAGDAPPRRIARSDAIPVALPLTKPVVMAGERVEHAHNLLVRVEAENGAGLVQLGVRRAQPRPGAQHHASLSCRRRNGRTAQERARVNRLRVRGQALP